MVLKKNVRVLVAGGGNVCLGSVIKEGKVLHHIFPGGEVGGDQSFISAAEEKVLSELGLNVALLRYLKVQDKIGVSKIAEHKDAFWSGTDTCYFHGLATNTNYSTLREDSDVTYFWMSPELAISTIQSGPYTPANAAMIKALKAIINPLQY